MPTVRLTPDRDPRDDLRLYTRYALNDAGIWTEREIRAEYTRLRDIAQKRLKRLERSEPESYAYRQNVGVYGPARGMTTDEIKDLLPDLARFISAKAGSVSGIRAIRKQTLETLWARGYTFVTPENLREFGDFMDAWRADKELHSIGSVEAAEFYGWSTEHEIGLDQIRQDFALYLKKRDELKNYVNLQNAIGREITADMIFDEFNRLKKAEEKKKAAQVRSKRKK